MLSKAVISTHIKKLDVPRVDEQKTKTNQQWKKIPQFRRKSFHSALWQNLAFSEPDSTTKRWKKNGEAKWVGFYISSWVDGTKPMEAPGTHVQRLPLLSEKEFWLFVLKNWKFEKKTILFENNLNNWSIKQLRVKNGPWSKQSYEPILKNLTSPE